MFERRKAGDGFHTIPVSIIYEGLVFTRVQAPASVPPPTRVRSAHAGGQTVFQTPSFDMSSEADIIAELIQLGKDLWVHPLL